MLQNGTNREFKYCKIEVRKLCDISVMLEILSDINPYNYDRIFLIKNDRNI